MWLPDTVREPVNRLGCLRGISALTGLALTVEIGDWSRFTGSSIGAYVGLGALANTHGQSRVQGSITKAGNTHVRRLLIESAWHHRKSYSTSGPRCGPAGPSRPRLRARGHAGNRRLNKRWRSFTERGKNPLVANVAVARERWLVLVSGHHAVARLLQYLTDPGDQESAR